MKVHTRVVYDIETMEVLEDEWYEYDGPVSECKGGGGGTTVQKSEPPEYLKPYLIKGANEADRLYSESNPSFFPGQTYADYNPLQVQAQEMTLQNAKSLQPQLNQLNAAQRFSLGDVLNPDSNPYLQSAAQGAIRPIAQQLTQEVLPGIRSRAVSQGAYSGNRVGLQEAQAIEGATRAMGDVTSRMYSNAYGQGLDHMGRAMSLAPQTMQLNQLPAQLVAGVGDQYQAMDQAGIDEAMARHNFNQNIQQQKLQQYMGLLQGSNFGMTQTAQGPGRNRTAGALGGAASGAMYGSMVMPGIGTAIGALAGGLLGGM